MPTLELFRDPRRTAKPRETGLTHVLDKGLSVAELGQVIEVAGPYLDILKFGWGTAVVATNLAEKIALCRAHDIEPYCGGSLFELAVMRDKVDDYVAFMRDAGITMVEVSDGVMEMPAAQKLGYIEHLAKEFRVLSEVGSKDTEVVVAPYRWVRAIKAELAAGAWKVVTEGRESGTVGLYRESGEIRAGLIETIEVELDPQQVLFEAPQKFQQTWLIKHFGPNVNLGNIAPEEVLSVETLRQGLRADTMI